MSRDRALPAAYCSALLVTACLVVLLRSGPAPAQSIDYGAAEALFGEPVTASATGKPQRVSDVPANMEIITAEQIRRSGADNLPDILRFVPGLDVRRYGFAAADIGVRGYARPSNPRLLVLVNGQQVYLDDYGRTQWYALPVELDEIRQIEVVKGPNTALFGFNAASGVINIVTWDPLRDRVNSVTARTGTQGYRELSAVGTAQVANWGGVRVSAGGFQAHDFDPRGFSAADQASRRSPQRGSLAIDGRARVAPGVEVVLNASVVNLRASEQAATVYSSADYYRTNAVRTAVTADTRVGLLALSFYRNQSRFSYQGSVVSGDIQDTLYVAQASDTLKLGTSHTVRLGLEYRNSSASSSRDFAGQVGYQVVSGSLMWDWQVTPTVSVTNAVRLDHFTLNQSGPLLAGSGLTSADYQGRAITEPSFNSGVVWHVTDQDTLRLTAARGLQLPSLVDLGYQSRTSVDLGPIKIPVYYLGSPKLRASAVSNLELGYDRALPILKSSVRVSVFAQRTDDVITDPFGAVPAFDGRVARLVASNTGHSSAVGSEIGIRGQAPTGAEGSLRWNLSYAYISVSDHLANTTYALQDFQHGTPTHVVVLGGGYSVGKLELDVQGRWQSRYRDYRLSTAAITATSTIAAAPLEIANYVQVDARACYRVTDHLTLALTAQQFIAQRLVQSAGPPVERRLLVSATARF